MSARFITQTNTLEQLALRCRMGRADALQLPATQPTGYAQLDNALPGGGLPIGAVTEVLVSQTGVGELSLLMPLLRQLTAQDRYVVLIEPPHQPYPPALLQHGIKLNRLLVIRTPPTLALWSSEQTLRCKAFGCVLLWLENARDKEIRRLQLAAEAGGNVAIVYRPFMHAQQTSPAAVRLSLQATSCGMQIEIKKCRGGRAGKVISNSLDERRVV
jgi:hypothetical protein